ncbi:MAG: carbon storage regulator [Planctomycetales bacterium]|nr:carbon storage regulator [Planctomycetales bacterium]NIM09986.1 carbon storage regulator [Planctomycetales bacterium]NIN09424.1 carbon storage regulator [Planctomycetales bacterium]NIN78531.1 carbon storage regulator [Planctomycetales bacterium]NIO35724.1 carbon storage regulator [Planctomycetales bacterium]
MLVLSRKRNQAIQVGEDIVITVVSIQGNRVKLGIQAPQHVSVVRQELLAFAPQPWGGAALGTASMGPDSQPLSDTALPAR